MEPVGFFVIYQRFSCLRCRFFISRGSGRFGGPSPGSRGPSPSSRELSGGAAAALRLFLNGASGMRAMPKIATMFDMFGPYHLARLNALGAKTSLLGLEVFCRSEIYQWKPIGAATTFTRKTLFADDGIRETRYHVMENKVAAELNDFRPDTVLVPGWATRPAIAMLRWAIAHGIPAVAMSESTEADASRSAIKEVVKREIVSCFAAGLVGGTRQKAYLAKLGIPDARITFGYNAVDNRHFARGAAAARADESRIRAELSLPQRFFLASARFIRGKKNLIGLIEAFARFVQRRLDTTICLVILGDGPLRQEIETTIAALGLDRRVILPGFQQYDALPAYYGLAEGFVHVSRVEPWGLVVNEAMAAGLPVIVSRECGCAADLVHEGENGFAVPCNDLDMIGSRFATLGDLSQTARDQMGARSREIVAAWSPEEFANGALDAAKMAIDVGPKRVGALSRALLMAFPLAA